MPLPVIQIDEPTIAMTFTINTSPFSGKDGKFVTSRQIKDRLDRELLGNVSIRVEPTESPEQMKVVGRGELQLSILIEMMRREGFELQVSRPQIVTRDMLDGDRVIGADQVLVGRNATRRAYNLRMRQRRGFSDELPAAGDKLVCLRNNKRKGLFNGALWSVKEKPTTRRDIIKMRLQPDDGFAGKGIKVSVRPECFTGGIENIEWPMRKPFDEFDYGYVLTVHKAQGSQWDNVVLFDESSAFAESRQRWLYTGVTRAAKQLTLVV